MHLAKTETNNVISELNEINKAIIKQRVTVAVTITKQLEKHKVEVEVQKN